MKLFDVVIAAVLFVTMVTACAAAGALIDRVRCSAACGGGQ